MGIPRPSLGITWAVDTNFFPLSLSKERQELWELHLKGYVKLTRSDVLGTELIGAQPGLRASLEEEVRELDEYLGPGVFGHSRYDRSVFGSPEDERRLDKVFAVLFPAKARGTASKNDLRDAMHVASAIRSGLDGFITEDDRLLRRQEAIRKTFNDFPLLSPAEALKIAQRLNRRASERGIS